MPRGYSRKLQKDWRDKIHLGDVLYEGGNQKFPRVVRCATYHDKKGGFLGSVTFAIKHCSWTGRCYTVVGRSDLKCRGFTPANVRVKFTSVVDQIINEELSAKSWRPPGLECCDVRGVL